jgi:hypothetical protein
MGIQMEETHILLSSISKSLGHVHCEEVRSRIVRAFNAQAKVTLDFDGVDEATELFFQELMFPLVAEYGAEVVGGRLGLANLGHFGAAMARGLGGVEAHLDRKPDISECEGDQELFEINLSMLVKARELCRFNHVCAKAVFGIEDGELLDAISQATYGQLQTLARSGWLCYVPRFSVQSLKTAMVGEPLDALLTMSGAYHMRDVR